MRLETPAQCRREHWHALMDPVKLWNLIFPDLRLTWHEELWWRALCTGQAEEMLTINVLHLPSGRIIGERG